MGNTKASLTEQTLPDQSGKASSLLFPSHHEADLTLIQVFIVTGSNSGIGKELAQILYGHNAKVYIAARSEAKAIDAIQEIKSKHPTSRGALVYLHLDLNDLTTVKSSADAFLAQEKSLHVLWNNAGAMRPPQGSATKQGYELQIGTNNVAPFLFTKLLTPLLIETAKRSSPNSVRVVWVSSSAPDSLAPPGGLDVNNLDYKKDAGSWAKYAISKAGNIYHGKEYARRFGKDGIISIVTRIISVV